MKEEEGVEKKTFARTHSCLFVVKDISGSAAITVEAKRMSQKLLGIWEKPSIIMPLTQPDLDTVLQRSAVIAWCLAIRQVKQHQPCRQLLGYNALLGSRPVLS